MVAACSAGRFDYWDCFDSWNPTWDAQRLSVRAAHIHSSSGLPLRPSIEIGGAAPAQGSMLRYGPKFPSDHTRRARDNCRVLSISTWSGSTART